MNEKKLFYLIFILSSVLIVLSTLYLFYLLKLDRDLAIPGNTSNILSKNLEIQNIKVELPTNYNLNDEVKFASGHIIFAAINSQDYSSQLFYDNKSIFKGHASDYSLSQNGLHYIFTSYDSIGQKYNLYIDNQIQKDFPASILVGVTNQGEPVYIPRTVDEAETTVKSLFVGTKETYKGKFYAYPGFPQSIRVSENGDHFMLTADQYCIYDGKIAANQGDIATFLSSDGKHFGSISKYKSMVDSRNISTLSTDVTQSAINNNGDWFLVNVIGQKYQIIVNDHMILELNNRPMVFLNKTNRNLLINDGANWKIYETQNGTFLNIPAIDQTIYEDAEFVDNIIYNYIRGNR